jgi:hypothetical protein
VFLTHGSEAQKLPKEHKTLWHIPIDANAIETHGISVRIAPIGPSQTTNPAKRNPNQGDWKFELTLGFLLVTINDKMLSLSELSDRLEKNALAPRLEPRESKPGMHITPLRS